MAYAKIILNGETLMDVTSDTVDSSNLLSGNTATKNSGAKVNGSIITKNEADIYELYSGSYYDVIIPSGYYSSNATLELPLNSSANVTFTSSTAFFSAPAGYYSTTATKTLTTQAAQAIYPSTADQYVSSYRWLTGSQTIKSVTTANLTAANIASGVTVKVGDANNASRITQVTGTYAPTTSSLTVTPTETSQTFNATGVYGYKPVTVNGISSTYVGTGVAKKSSTDTTFASATGTFTAPIGYYSSSATKTVTTQPVQTIYPSTADQYITSYRWLTGSQTIKSVTTTNLTASNVAEGVVVKVGDVNNASRITQITGTYSGVGTTYTALITSSTTKRTYVTYNNTVYRSGSFAFHPGEICYMAPYGEMTGGTIYEDGVSLSYVDGYNSSYAYTLPSHNIGLSLSTNGGGAINITSTPTFYITSNGTYNVYGYVSASVNVTGEGVTVDDIAMRTISGDISGNATIIGSYAFYNCYSLTTVSFPNATSISNYAFVNCYSLTTANFPSVTTIGNSAFYSCHSLTTISFPSVTSIGSSAFFNCYLLTTANFPNATSVGGYVFYCCSSLTTASFPSATTIGTSAFYSCAALTTISFPNATNIGSYAFYQCSKLTTASFPSVTAIGISAFAYCSKLTTMSFPNVTSIGTSAFRNCSALTTVSFPSATSIDSYAFAYCLSLTTASFPSAISISTYAFASCRNLLSFYLLGSSVPTLGTGVFYSTPIGGYTTSTGGVYGSIFVPSSLYNSYIAATNWSIYSARIVSV